MQQIQVQLPGGLQTLAGVGATVSVTVAAPATPRAVVQALEQAYPALAGTLIQPTTGQRRPLIRFFACQQDISHWSLDAELPGPVQQGSAPLLVVGAIAGG